MAKTINTAAESIEKQLWEGTVQVPQSIYPAKYKCMKSLVL